MAFNGKIDWKYNDIPTERDFNRIEQGVVDAHKMLEVNETRTLSFTPGTQVIESNIDTPITVDNVTGRTLVNLLGRIGSCDSLYGWNQHKDAGNPTFGVEKGTIKLTTDVTGTLARIAYFIPAKTALKLGGKYLAAATVKCSVTGQAGIYCGGSPVQHNKTTDWETIFSLVSVNTSTDSYLVVGSATQANITTYVDNVRLYEVTETEYAALSQMSPEQLERRYPYVDGMTNVMNPYAIVTGENLLPPFTEWGNMHAGIKQMSEPFAFTMKTAARDEVNHFFPANSGETYTLSVAHTGRIGVNAWDASGLLIGKLSIVPYTTEQTATFTTPAETVQISIHFGNVTGEGEKDYLPSCEFKKPMLTAGTRQQSFKPQKRSMWAVEAELAANPVTGADADVLYTGDDGLPYVLEKWVKVRFDESVDYKYYNTYPSGKCVRVKFDFSDVLRSSLPYVSKFDSSIVVAGAPSMAVDVFSSLDWGSTGVDFLGIGVKAEDSGWGDTYQPTIDEIKAYFLGWTMYNGATGNSPDVPANNLYNGTGTKWWVRRADGVGREWRDATAELPTTMADGWTPYRLQYLKASPSVVPVSNYEAGAVLTTGDNVVEIDSGMVIREKANVFVSQATSAVAIGDTSWPTNHKIRKGLAVYFNNSKDVRWYESNINPYGLVKLRTSIHNYDPTATYHATYTMFAPTLAATINVKAVANMRGTVTKLVDQAGDVERRLSVVEMQKVDANAVVTWVKLTLLNGWVNRGIDSDAPVSYLKDSLGFVHVRGLAASGTPDRVIFKLPKDYRPIKRMQFINLSYQGAAEKSLRTSYITIEVNGDVYVNAQVGTQWLTLDNISFLAEQ
ncbi:hypothetical protein [Paenibacillus agilis]|uniref:Uncharacterized protein n=1 Tax=Paenibacillus agilis TaxID=3020863 RepID=A0A559IWE3_9BACL|nr:hypothetical protein [Paenibacillus agilis]TVX91911.1 hypothetical protein FPZ44_01835 [Paenibacillus agilis]